MIRRLAAFLYFRVLGWREDVSVERPEKCINCVAPHTSNYDFLIAKLYYAAIGRRSGFLMKKEWFFWPLGAWFRSMGGIPVDRSRRGSTTDRIAEAARREERFEIAITPEATRSRNATWRRGFYYIAQKAGIPVVYYKIDFRQRCISAHLAFTPSDNAEADWEKIRAYYADAAAGAKHPELFACDGEA